MYCFDSRSIWRFGSFLSTVFTAVCLIRDSPIMLASDRKALRDSVGRITASLPLLSSSCIAPSSRFLKDSDDVCRAVARAVSGFSRALQKYGGLLTMRSNVCACCRKFWKAALIMPILSANGDAATFRCASAAAISSISTPVTCASLKRCASIRAISPVPVPTSRMRNGCPSMACHAPSSTPSVPTFIALSDW